MSQNKQPFQRWWQPPPPTKARSMFARVLDGLFTAALIAVLPILTGILALKLAAAMANGNAWAQAALVWLIGAAALPGILLVIFGIWRILAALRR